jgi:hypothetical protein
LLLEFALRVLALIRRFRIDPPQRVLRDFGFVGLLAEYTESSEGYRREGNPSCGFEEHHEISLVDVRRAEGRTD